MLTVAARSALGQVLGGLGKIASANTVLKSAVDAAAYVQEAPTHRASPIDQRVNCRVWLARYLAIAGFPEKAVKLTDETVAEADDGSHSATVALALSLASMTHLMVGKTADAVRYGKSAAKLAEEQELRYFVTIAQKSWALAQVFQGKGDESIDKLKEGFVAERSLGDRYSSVRGQVYLAEALYFVGRYSEALDALEEFFAAARASNLKDFLAEAHRLHGQLVLDGSSYCIFA